MQTEWFRNLEGSTKDERRELIKAHAPILDVLKSILEVRLSDTLTKQKDKQAYGSPSWPYEQADSNGEQRALKFVLSMLDLTKESK